MPTDEVLSHTRELSARERFAENFAKSKFGGWFAINIANRVDRGLMKVSGNRVNMFGVIAPTVPVGLLTSTGAKSGKERKTPLLYVPHEGNVLLIASKAGAEKNPAWYHNLKANPEVGFTGRGESGTYVAREAKGRERAKLWEVVNDVYVGYETYQERAGDRKIPIMVLEPKA
jgi:F420H(2)-dependent quinone reductase